MTGPNPLRYNIMYYVYFLILNNGQLYTGRTANLQRRVNEHTAGKVLSTRKRLPVRLLGYEAYKLKSDSMRRELFLKTTEGKRLLRHQYKDILAVLSGEMLELAEQAGLENR
jgi:putative endonuclease